MKRSVRDNGDGLGVRGYCRRDRCLEQRSRQFVGVSLGAYRLRVRLRQLFYLIAWRERMNSDLIRRYFERV